MDRQVLGAVCVAMGLAFNALADPISYQGQLKDQGVLASGEYDFKFQLYSSEFGSTQIAVEQVVDDVSVMDGVFSLDLDFGDVFDQNEAWIRVLVRPGDSIGLYTALLPRELITTVPKASFAKVAETSLDSFWQDAGTDEIMFGTGIQRVLINREDPIQPDEFFGVHANTAGIALGGMNISTNADGQPYYGYAVDGVLEAYTYFAPAQSTWNIWIGGSTVFNLDSNGNLIVAGNMAAGDILADGAVTGNSYVLNTPRTLVYSVSGDSFHSGSGNSFAAGDAVGGAYQTQSGQGWLMAPVNLPDGAVVTSVRISFLDNATGDMAVALQARSFTGTLTEMALIQTTGASVAVGNATTTTITDGMIDNTMNGYHLRAFSSFWPGNLLLRIFGVQIEYTVDEVQ